jgi:hypothetical protein
LKRLAGKIFRDKKTNTNKKERGRIESLQEKKE